MDLALGGSDFPICHEIESEMYPDLPVSENMMQALILRFAPGRKLCIIKGSPIVSKKIASCQPASSRKEMRKKYFSATYWKQTLAQICLFAKAVSTPTGGELSKNSSVDTVARKLFEQNRLCSSLESDLI